MADLPQLDALWRPSMARPHKQNRQRGDDLPLDKIPFKKTKSSRVYARPSRAQSREARASNPPHHQVPSENTNPAAFPRPSTSGKQKRRAGDPPQDQIPSKKPKSSSTVHRPSNFPPEFYDNLSKIWLTRRALRELDWRNEHRPPSQPRTRLVGSRGAKLAALAKLRVPDLALFATAGGPDLSHLQGVCLCAQLSLSSTITPSSVTSKGVSAGSARTQSTKATAVSLKSKRSSAYDANFEQNCIDHTIYPPVYKFPDGRRPSKPANFQDIRQALKVPRGSLSPSVVPETAFQDFQDFQDKNATRSEGTVMRNVVPLVAGDGDIPNEGHLPFANVDSITGNTTVNPVPDFFDGAHPGAVDRKVREDLDKVIIPNKKLGIPVAPNFFLEAKGPGGTIEVAVGQAVLDGAHGALMMHALQNYLLDEPVYDGNAYAFTSTLLDGYLKLYAHHLTAPAMPGQRPGCHTTLLKAYALSDDEVYSEGRGAFRNLRLRAREDRDRFINIANARARNLGREDRGDAKEADHLASTNQEHQHGGSSPFDFYDCQMFAEPEDNDRETQGTNVGLAISHHVYGQDDADDTAVSTGFATSLTSSLTSVSREDHLPSQHQPEMPRSPPSPSSARHTKKRAPTQIRCCEANLGIMLDPQRRNSRYSFQWASGAAPRPTLN